MLKKLTKQYINAFNCKDIEKLSLLFTDNFALEDPIVKRIEGKIKVLEAINNIFNSCDKLDFIAKNIYQDNDTTIIEFKLKLDDTILTGSDIIQWEDEKMIELRAYLDVPCGDK
jgi:ketosteroid isomerase-like protein